MEHINSRFEGSANAFQTDFPNILSYFYNNLFYRLLAMGRSQQLTISN
jgi:hypothetical protein